MRAVWELPAAADTVRLGAALGQALAWSEQGPRLIFLTGELGAGKTTLAAALLGALGATETVRSPSYALVETYPMRGGLGVHLDCYRLADAREFEQLGLRDYSHLARSGWSSGPNVRGRRCRRRICRCRCAPRPGAMAEIEAIEPPGRPGWRCCRQPFRVRAEMSLVMYLANKT